MSIVIHCNNCTYKTRIHDHLAGKTVACPKCRAAILVPSPHLSKESRTAANADGDTIRPVVSSKQTKQQRQNHRARIVLGTSLLGLMLLLIVLISQLFWTSSTDSGTEIAANLDNATRESTPSSLTGDTRSNSPTPADAEPEKPQSVGDSSSAIAGTKESIATNAESVHSDSPDRSAAQHPEQQDGTIQLEPLVLDEPVTNMAVTDDRQFLILTHQAANSISVYDISKSRVAQTIACQSPGSVLCRGSKVFVAGRGTNAINVYSQTEQLLHQETLTIDRSGIVHLSAAGPPFFQHELLVTCHGNGVEASYQDSHIFLLNTETKQSRRLSAAPLASVSFDGRTVVTQDSFRLSPSGGLQGFNYSDFCNGDAKPIFRGGITQTPYVSQVLPGSFWLGDHLILSGSPPAELPTAEEELLVPDLSQRVVYSFTTNSVRAHRLNSVLTEIGRRSIQLPSGFSVVPETGHRLERMRNYMLDHSFAITHNDELRMFVWSAERDILLTLTTKPFQIPDATTEYPTLAEIDSEPNPPISDDLKSSAVPPVSSSDPENTTDASSTLRAAPLTAPATEARFSDEAAGRVTVVDQARAEGQISSAVQQIDQLIRETRSSREDDHTDVQLLNAMRTELVALQEMQEQIEALKQKQEFYHAEVLAKRILKIELNHFDVNHPRCAECRKQIQTISDLLRELTKPWDQLQSAVYMALDQKDLDGAIQKSIALSELQKITAGEMHTMRAATLMNVAEYLMKDNRTKEAIPFQEEATRIRTQFHGSNNFRIKLDNSLLDDMRRIARMSKSHQIRINKFLERANDVPTQTTWKENQQSLRMHQAEFEFLQEKLGTQSDLCLSEMLNLAEQYRKAGDLKRTDELQSQALHLIENSLGKDHPLYADAMIRIATTAEAINDTDRALAYANEVVLITRNTYGEEHEKHINALISTSGVLHKIGDYKGTRSVLTKAIALFLSMHEPDAPELAHCYVRLAFAEDVLGEKPSARVNAEKAIQILQKNSQQKSTTYVQALNLLSLLDIHDRQYEMAERRLLDVIDRAKDVYGAKHRVYAVMLANAAAYFQRMGKPERSIKLLEDVIPIVRATLDDTFSIQSEQQQLISTDENLGFYAGFLSVAVGLENYDEKIYNEVLNWKGAVFRHQGRRGIDPRVSVAPEILNSQRDAARRMSRLASEMLDTVIPPPDAIDKLVQAQMQYQEAARSVVTSTRNTDSQPGTLDPESLTSLIPENVVVIDFQIYSHNHLAADAGEASSRHEQRILAFVLRKSHPVRMVQLGSLEQAANAIQQLKDSVLSRSGNASPGTTDVAGRNVADLLWKPLEPLLDEPDLVIICPDGPLIEVPFSALPGKKPGTYLLEDLAIASIPTLQILPRIVATNGTEETPSSALLVGDINFSATNVESAPGDSKALSDRAAGFRFTQLPGTTAEIEEISKLFNEQFSQGRLKIAKGSDPTEAFIYENLADYKYLHLATHGFYAPVSWSNPNEESNRAGLKRYLERHAPSLLSGLALAGANQSTLSAHDNLKSVSDDGILTSLEVSTLSLQNVELAVLSACESTLGQAPAGEGMLGLQRAFQVAGVKSTITSLWKVDDAATQALMVEFYRNLWGKRLSRIESLRQAQLAMLNHYDATSRQLAARGLTLINPQQAHPSDNRLAPFFWAPFVLSGDWR